MNNWDKSALFNAISKIPQTERENVVFWALKLFTESMNGFDRSLIIEDLAQVPQAERPDVIAWALKLRIEKMSISTFIKALAPIPQAERADVVALGLKLCTEEISISTIIEALAPIPKAERADVVTWALKLFTISSLQRGSTIRYIAQIPSEEREDVVDMTLKLSNEKMNGNDKAAYLEEVLTQVPQAERGDVITWALQLFTERMSGFEKALIVIALIKILQKEKSGVVESAIGIIPSIKNRFDLAMSGFDRASLITAITQVLHEETLQLLFTETMNNYDKGLIIVALAQIPQAIRADVIDKASKLFNDSLNAEARISIIKALAKLSEEERDYISLSISKKEMSLYDILEAISFINKIPISQQNPLFKDSLSLCDASMTWSEKITVLHVMQNTPYQQEDLKLAEKYFTPDMSWREKLNLFLSRNPQLNLDENLPLAETEEDFEDLVEGDLNLEDFFTPLPSDSLFADTDLTICKENFPHVLPLNGIKLSELKEIEALAIQIFSGNGKIKIDSSDKQLEKQAQDCIKKLLTRSIGRNLIKKVMENPDINSLTIRPGRQSGKLIPYYQDTYINLPKDEPLSIQNQIPYIMPLFIILGHELIHASHRYENLRHNVKQRPTLHPDYDNLEEQITIAGFKEDIELPESVKLKPEFEKNMEWLKSQNVEEGWEEEPTYTGENFDPINERNLHAAFVNSKQLFHPRTGHRGSDMKIQILENPDVALKFVKEKIVNHLIQAKLKAPQNLQKVYAKLIIDALPS